MKTRKFAFYVVLAVVLIGGAALADSFASGNIYIPGPFMLIFGNGSSGDVQVTKSAANTMSVNAAITTTGAITSTGATAAVTTNSANGASWVRGQISESITLSTSGLTTDSTADLLPANSVINAVVCRVTTTITTSTAWAVGDSTVAARFIAADSTLTANETQIGIIQWNTANANTSGPVQTSAAKLRITASTSNPGAGVVRCTTFYSQFVAPTS